MDVFADSIDYWFEQQENNIHGAIQSFVGLLLDGDAEGVARVLNEDLLGNPSYHDYIAENSYHMFIFGILLAVSRNYVVLSNRESGKGRSDCLIKPDDNSRTAVVIEFKHLKDRPSGSPMGPEDLAEEARKGMAQIDEMAYIHSLKQEGYPRVYKYAIAFHGKSCEVAMEVEPLAG